MSSTSLILKFSLFLFVLLLDVLLLDALYVGEYKGACGRNGEIWCSREKVDMYLYWEKVSYGERYTVCREDKGL